MPRAQDLPPSPRGSRRSQLHRLGPAVPLLLGLYALVSAYGLSLGELNQPGPGLWPFMVALLLTGTSAVLLLVDHRDDYEPWTTATAKIAGGLISLGIFIALFEVLGFFIPAVLMLILWLKVFGEEPWKWAVPLAVGGAILFHLVFVEALGVPFPKGPLVFLSAAAVGS